MNPTPDFHGRALEIARQSMTKLVRRLHINQAFHDTVMACHEARPFKLAPEFWGSSWVTSCTIHVQKAGDIIPVLRKLRKLGPDWRVTQRDDSPEVPSRTYRLGALLINITVDLSLADNSAPTCRYVQVGSETIEKPIYELVCDDGEEG